MINFDYVGRQGARAVTLTNDISICSPAPAPAALTMLVWCDCYDWEISCCQTSGETRSGVPRATTSTTTSPLLSSPECLDLSRPPDAITASALLRLVAASPQQTQRKSNVVTWSTGPVGLHQQLAETLLKLYCLVSWVSC